MKIKQANAGALTNFEVLDLLRSRGASKDPTRVMASLKPSELKVYDYLVETAACDQKRENINEFIEECKTYDLAKAEILNIINIHPTSLVEIDPIIEAGEERTVRVTELVEMINKVLLPIPSQSSSSNGRAEQDSGDDYLETEPSEMN
ncbi:hypothetical protein Nepgr_029572 [Nepenthes gracilis]|uniref:DNA-directed RNA polymerase III subunit RPC9 n=1 Tax=Nepenthes gracilis TaxID=150966 RepID=A0AAD3TEG7_NEPGR|nr:hypothetical protein Nepgr_029572 [Nepenthes gracilis]